MSAPLNTQPKIQTAAQRLEYLLSKKKKANKKSRIELFTYWLESVSVEEIAKYTSLKDISTAARNLLIKSGDELNDGKKLLLQWSRPPVRQQSSRFKSTSNGNIQLLKESAKEIEIWLFSVAIYILWKRESKSDEALELCSRVIGFVTTLVNNIMTLSPRSHMERERNEDKKATLNILKSNLQSYETLLSQECVNSCIDSKNGQKSLFSLGHKQRLESLKRRMEFNSQRLKSLNTKLDLDMMSFCLDDITTAKEINQEKETLAYFLPPSGRTVTLSDILYPHLVYHPYFNAP